MLTGVCVFLCVCQCAYVRVCAASSVTLRGDTAGGSSISGWHWEEGTRDREREREGERGREREREIYIYI